MSDEPFLLFSASRDYLAGNSNPLLGMLGRRKILFGKDQGIGCWVAVVFFCGLGLLAALLEGPSRLGWEKWLNTILFLLTGIAVISLIVGRDVWMVASAKRLLNQGQKLPGRIVSCRGARVVYGEDGYAYDVTVEYEFESPDGRTTRATASEYRDDLEGQPLPDPGHPVVVLYVSDDRYLLL